VTHGGSGDHERRAILAEPPRGADEQLILELVARHELLAAHDDEWAWSAHPIAPRGFGTWRS